MRLNQAQKIQLGILMANNKELLNGMKFMEIKQYAERKLGVEVPRSTIECCANAAGIEFILQRRSSSPDNLATRNLARRLARVIRDLSASLFTESPGLSQKDIDWLTEISSGNLIDRPGADPSQDD